MTCYDTPTRGPYFYSICKRVFGTWDIWQLPCPAALRKLCKLKPQDVMIRLYKAYVLPHLEYCSPLLLGISNRLKNKLEDTNYYILRTILRYSCSVFYDFLLNLAELQNLETRRQFQSLVILYKCLRGQGPEYLSEFFNVLNVNYNLRGIAHASCCHLSI